MAFRAAVLAVTLVVGGCSTTTYRVPKSELARLAQLPPEQRGERVRVIQELQESSAPPAEGVSSTTVVFIPEIHISSGIGGRGGGGASTSSGGVKGGGPRGGKAADSKAQAVVMLVLAATALVVVAGIEGSRFDGWARLHPMHPVHVFGTDGNYAAIPLAAFDAQTVAWVDRAYVRDTEGPWQPLERAPLSRTGFTYSMYAGTGSLESKFGDKELGPAFALQLGYFPQQSLGVNLTAFFGWRENRIYETLYETRYTLEVQGFPVQAGPFHAGLFGGIGFGYRWEDGIITGRVPGEAGTSAFNGGAMLQLDVNTRIALTARFGVSRAHGEEMNDIAVGISVY